MTSAVIPKRKQLFSVVAAVLFHLLTIFFFFLEASILKREASGYEPPGYCQLVFVELCRINMNKRVFLAARSSSERDGGGGGCGGGGGPECEVC